MIFFFFWFLIYLFFYFILFLSSKRPETESWNCGDHKLWNQEMWGSPVLWIFTCDLSNVHHAVQYQLRQPRFVPGLAQSQMILKNVALTDQTHLKKMVFCYQNCSDLLWEKIALVIEKNFWNLRLKAENLQNS